MRDRHKENSLSIRLPGAERAWVTRKATRLGVPRTRVIIEAIRLAMREDQEEGSDGRLCA